MSNSTHLLNNAKAQDRIDELERLIERIDETLRAVNEVCQALREYLEQQK